MEADATPTTAESTTAEPTVPEASAQPTAPVKPTVTAEGVSENDVPFSNSAPDPFELIDENGEFIAAPVETTEEAETAEAEPKTEEPAVEKPSTVEQQLAQLMEMNKALQARLDAMSQPQAPTPPAETMPPPIYPTINPTDEVQFITKDEFLATFNDAEAYNKHLNSVRQRLLTENAKHLLPAVVNIARQEIQSQQLVSNFYQANPDLVQFKPYVGVTYNEVQAKNPSKSPEEILSLVATEVRNKLKLTEKATAAPAPTRPAARPFPPTPGARPQTTRTANSQDQFINDLL